MKQDAKKLNLVEHLKPQPRGKLSDRRNAKKT